jgi:DNA-directed RNA polymerase subunit beta'
MTKKESRPTFNLKDFDMLRIKLASPEEILSWSHGEVLKPETINYRTYRAEKDGLFDERIFGPTKDYECYCGKYKRIRFKGVVCDKCGVEVTSSRVRRERMGHIKLATPCAHVWFFRGIPSQMSIILGISPRALDSVIYFSSFLVTGVDRQKKTEVISRIDKEHEKNLKDLKKETSEKIEQLEKKAAEKIRGLDELVAKGVLLGVRKEIAQERERLQREKEKRESAHKRLRDNLKGIKRLSVIPEQVYDRFAEYINAFAVVGTGAVAVKTVLEDLDVDKAVHQLKRQLAKAHGQKAIKLSRRLRLLEGMHSAGVDPAWMILTVLPVIPPDLRPLVQLEGGRFAASDLNDLYRRVINRNNRLKDLLEIGAPEVIVRNEKRMLQEAVDSLIDISRRRGTTRPRRGRQELRSLTDMLKGKQGRFRQNLLGKRVDYSGRSVIVVGPELKLAECGIPKEMALELFKPFVLREIMREGLAPNVKSARTVWEERPAEVWDILDRLVKDHPVLLNRAPTLHRLGIQAFYPKLIDGKAIQIHPCVCAGYNADFDGDQMAVHLPLSAHARRESHEVMRSTRNLLKPSSGVPITVPDKDMIIGTYYLTAMRPAESSEIRPFASEEDALVAYSAGRIGLRVPIRVPIDSTPIETTVGRIIFNRVLPPSLRFFNQETNKQNGAVKKLIAQCLEKEGPSRTVKLIDDLKELGFRYATLSGVSMGIFDAEIAARKDEILKMANEKAAEIDRSFRRGLITRREKLRLSEQLWVEVTEELDTLTWENMDKDNPIRLMVASGARGTRDMVKQIAGIRGLIVDSLGRLVELPIRSNYRQGLTGFEYFNSARGGRKGLIDTALKTADAGYLTRRLVDVAQEVLVREEDCQTKDGLTLKKGDDTLLTTFAERLVGRFAAHDVVVDGEVFVSAGELISEEVAQKISAAEVEEVTIRSPLACETRYGICRKCYGVDLATDELVEIGAAVGIMAAQSIGEPGTQLTLRTRHVGGIITAKDVTQGLPRVEEIFEARVPKDPALMAPFAGRVEIIEKGENERILRIKNTDKDGVPPEVEFELDPLAELTVEDGDLVGQGAELTKGFLDPEEILDVLGKPAAQKYLLKEVQKVYSSQGVALADKHIEVIIRQMLNKVRIESPGGTDFMPGEVVSEFSFAAANEKARAAGKDPATGETIVLGITKASLATESFLAAASFINTTRVLTEASLSGRVDHLRGLKENVIIGRLIPTGERARLLGKDEDADD